MVELINGQLRMLSDRILLKPLDWKPSEIIDVVRHGRPLSGVVVAIGPGHHPIKRKNGPKGKNSLMDYSRHFRPTEVCVGDTVELGGLNVFDGKGYQFAEVMVNGELHIICQERDVAAVHERAA
jgi:co-chaperonin GroES (HSP10)